MRKNFAQVLRESGKIDISNEFEKIQVLFYGDGTHDSLYDCVRNRFLYWSHRGTYLSLQEFDEDNGFEFGDIDPYDATLDMLITFMEYCINMILIGDIYQAYSKMFNLLRYHIALVAEKLGYMESEEDGFTILVEKNLAAVSVSEILPKPLSYKVISYNHHSMKGDLEAKKETLLKFADLLEPKREILNSIDKTFSSDLFYLFNNFNLRHNNTDPTAKGKYKKIVADMSHAELEKWYDETYQMCLLAFLRIDHIDRKAAFDTIKDKIENS